MKKYKDFNYETETAEGTEDSSKNFQKRVRMECMPEIEDFEEKLGRIDKTLAIENRIKYVLDMMGFETNTKITSDAKKNILMLANKAIMLREISIEKAFLEVPDIANKSNETLISFSQGINDFIRQYDAEKKVKVLEFLTDLQKVILTNEEYKKIMESKN